MVVFLIMLRHWAEVCKTAHLLPKDVLWSRFPPIDHARVLLHEVCDPGVGAFQYRPDRTLLQSTLHLVSGIAKAVLGQ